MSKPIVEREGDDLVFSWPAEGIRVRADHVKDSHDELRAELTVESTAANETGVLWWGGLNLKAARSRSEVANALYARAPLDEFWQDALLYVSTLTKEAHRTGPPSVQLAEIPYSAQTPYLMSNLLPLGENTVIYGDGEAGKSAFLRAVCVSLLSGQPLHPLLVPLGAANIGWLDWETQAETGARWFARLGEGVGLSERPRVQYKRMLRTVMDSADGLRQWVRGEGMGLVCADSLALACGGDPRDPGIAVQAMNAFHSLGVTVAILAHISKGEALSGGPATIFGSVMFRNEARSAWELQAVEGMPPGEHAVTLYHRKSNEDERLKQPIGLRFVFQPQGGPITVSEYDALRNVAAARGLTQRQQVAACLSDAPLAVHEIAEQTGISAENVGRWLRTMHGFEAERVEDGGGRGNVALWRKAERRNGKADHPPLEKGGKAERLSKNSSSAFLPGESFLTGAGDQRDAGATNSFVSPQQAGAGDDEGDLDPSPF